MKIAKEFPFLLHLRPNVLLTRKPVLVVSSTTVYAWTTLKKRLFHWQIRRHGYPTKWPTPTANEVKMNPEKYQTFHILDIDRIPFKNCLDFLMTCAEKDYLEGPSSKT